MPPTARTAAAHFRPTYALARAEFVNAAEAAGFTLIRFEHPSARGAQDESLSIDVATQGPATAQSSLMVLSGTHGAEGFCGSGCQIALLRDAGFLAAAAAAGTRMVFLHALNPYGFSHMSRTNEDNVDLNRNFIDFTVPLLSSAAYAAVHDFIVPATWPPSPENEARLAEFVGKHGMAALQAAVTGGQHDHPDGIFYGGVRPAWSNQVLREVLRAEGRSSAAIAWIDLHTGLGPRGHGEKIFAGRDNPAELALAKAWWGEDVTSFSDGSSTSAPLTGVNYSAVGDECPSAIRAGIALEFGTLPLVEVLQALRASQWLINHPEAPEDARAAIRIQVRSAFYQDADDWKTMVVAQATSCANQALAALAATSATSR